MHYDAWFWDWSSKKFYRWEDLPKDERPDTWEHYCSRQDLSIKVEKTFMCPYCSKKENNS